MHINTRMCRWEAKDGGPHIPLHKRSSGPRHICTHAHIRTRARARAHTHTHTHTHTHVYTSIHIYAHAYGSPTFLGSNVHVYAYAHTQYTMGLTNSSSGHIHVCLYVCFAIHTEDSHVRGLSLAHLAEPHSPDRTTAHSFNQTKQTALTAKAGKAAAH